MSRTTRIPSFLAWPLAAGLCASPFQGLPETPATLTRLALAPAPGAELAKTFERHVELERTAHTVVVGGVAQEIESRYEITEDLRLELSDRYDVVLDSRVNELERRYIDVRSTYVEVRDDELQEGPQTTTVPSTSPLAGRGVRFVRAPRSTSLTATFAPDSEGSPPALLEELVADTDLASFLPEGAVAPGTSWAVPAASLREVLAPGGNLHLDVSAGDLPHGLSRGAGADFSTWLAELEGDVTATFEGLEERGGVELARVTLVLQMTSVQDQTARARELAAELAAGKEEDVRIDFLEISLALEGRGELFWDPASGLPSSAELSGTLGLVIDTGMTVIDAENLELEESTEYVGTFALSLATRP